LGSVKEVLQNGGRPFLEIPNQRLLVWLEGCKGAALPRGGTDTVAAKGGAEKDDVFMLGGGVERKQSGLTFGDHAAERNALGARMVRKVFFAKGVGGVGTRGWDLSGGAFAEF